MNKKITANELSNIVAKILLDPCCGAISGYETHQAFMTELADLVCVQLGGRTATMAELTGGSDLANWAVTIHVAEDDDEEICLWELIMNDFESCPLTEAGKKVFQLQATRLSELVREMLVENYGLISSTDSFRSFMTDVADVICTHCGGETDDEACWDDSAQSWVVCIAPNDSLPDDGGIWAAFKATSSADLAITSYYRDRANGVHAAKAP